MKNLFRPVFLALALLLLSAGTAAASSAPILSSGARGSDVAALQRLLTYHGHPVAITALIGPTTEGLIKDFQRNVGLHADGVVGPMTWQALQPTLRRGDSSEAVRALQHSLSDKHGYGINPDGVFGPATEAAVRGFQRHMGLLSDGITGPATWNALLGHFEQLPGSGPGWYSYRSADARWGTSHTITALRDLLWQWQQEGLPRLGVGDISGQHGGYLPGHASHRRGVDVDLRLVRTDGRATSVAYWDSAYSRNLTQRLVNMLHATGEVDLILFNDPHVRGVTYWPNHDSHLHVRFKR